MFCLARGLAAVQRELAGRPHQASLRVGVRERTLRWHGGAVHLTVSPAARRRRAAACRVPRTRVSHGVVLDEWRNGEDDNRDGVAAQETLTRLENEFVDGLWSASGSHAAALRAAGRQ